MTINTVYITPKNILNNMHYEDNTHDIRIYNTELVTTITCRADLANHILNLSKMYWGKPGIKVDKPLGNILKAFNIPFPDGGNGELLRILKKDGVFDDVEHYSDSEYSSVNTLFYTLDSYYKFVENFIDWIETNHKIGKPTIYFETQKQ